MLTSISGVVTNGVIVPSSPLPEGAHVEIQVLVSDAAKTSRCLSATELRGLPRGERQAHLAVAAKLAEVDYRDDKELTGFDAFLEEEFDGDDSN